MPRRFRPTVAMRLIASLSATALLSAALAMVLHDRTLEADLESAAQHRLERAAHAANRLAEDHLAALSERYRAISATPQLRASLEVGHAPTLSFYAESLRAREGPALLAFLDRRDERIALSGREDLADAAEEIAHASLVAVGREIYAVVSADLATSAGRVGRMVAAERVSEDTLRRWSELCGASVGLAPPGAGDPEALVRPARSLGALDLVVAASLADESAALTRSRASLVASGSIAVALSLVACVLLARGFVRPILAIRHAAERIRQGDLDVRLGSDRQDEIGDVARAFDLMLDGWVVSRRDLERNLAELGRSQNHLARAQELARLGSFELEFEKGRPTLLRGSEQLRQLFQLAPGDAPIEPMRLVDAVHPDDRDGVVEAVRAALASHTALRIDMRLRLPDGSERIVHAEAEPGRDDGGGVIRLEGTVQDVTDRRRAEQQIRYLAHHDALTGLGNRLLFSERLGLAVNQARRRDARVGVLLVDLDHFKRINDTLGPTIGDKVLCAVADRLVASLRDTDLVSRGIGTETAISRLAGDEFTLLLNDISDLKSLALVASRVLHALSQPLGIEGHEIVVSASIGIAAWPSDGADLDALLTNAGSAMDHAKQRGGNRYEFFAESMRQVGSELLETESRIRRALARGEFEMHYQPVVSLRDGRVTGFEALMRWRQPGAGLLLPGSFIPVAEHCGLILSLGEFAVDSACRQLAAWQQVLPKHEVPRVAVNLSPHQFKTGRLVHDVARAVETTGARPELLEIEITESAVLYDEANVTSDLERLRQMGISISLDDFGTGQSSLSHLRRLPVDTLKVDMSFVRSIEHSPQDARLTAAIVGLGRARGLRVVAEGVETEAQRSLLASWDCHEIQGFLISPALPADEAILLARMTRSDA
jgi:diguanylate cyclase (GGDEF)-like protein